MRVASLFLALLVGCPSSEPDTSVDSDPPDTDPVVLSDETNRDGECVFNRECPADQRCDCVDYVCACDDGARGTGQNGVDTCTVGNDCASSLCVEGSGADFYCTDECVDDGDCEAALPACIDVAFVGRICVRSGT